MSTATVKKARGMIAALLVIAATGLLLAGFGAWVSDGHKEEFRLYFGFTPVTEREAQDQSRQVISRLIAMRNDATTMRTSVDATYRRLQETRGDSVQGALYRKHLAEQLSLLQARETAAMATLRNACAVAQRHGFSREADAVECSRYAPVGGGVFT